MKERHSYVLRIATYDEKLDFTAIFKKCYIRVRCIAIIPCAYKCLFTMHPGAVD